ncbi:MAG: pilus assembly PilX family protein [Nitrospiria bacterium]
MKINQKNLVNNEKGMALVLAMVMLVLMTLIGFAAVNTSTTEVSLSGNYRLSADSFYVSEGGINFVIADGTLLTGTTSSWSATTVPITSTKNAQVSTKYLTTGVAPAGSGTGIHTARSANQYVIQSKGISSSGISSQEEVAAVLLPSS